MKIFISCKKSENFFYSNWKIQKMPQNKIFEKNMRENICYCHRTLSKSEIYKWSKRINKKNNQKTISQYNY